MDKSFVESLRHEREEARRSRAPFRPIARNVIGAHLPHTSVLAIQDALRSGEASFDDAVSRSVPPGVDRNVWEVACVAYVWSHREPRFLRERRAEFTGEARRRLPILLRFDGLPDPRNEP